MTGAAGKVGQAFIRHFPRHPQFESFVVRALCHNRVVDAARASRSCAARSSTAKWSTRPWPASTHVLHLATCKETPEAIMDVAIKGMFWLLEASRQVPGFEQFILIGGDAGMGHFTYPHPVPVTETQKHSAYPGCYALSKVMEEVMLEQYYIQYQLGGCCCARRGSWRRTTQVPALFGEDVFGGPRCATSCRRKGDEYVRTGAVPIIARFQKESRETKLRSRRRLVSAIEHAIDHPSARQQLFNVSMNEPVDYGELAAYLKQTRDLPSCERPAPYHSTWLDNSKAKLLLGWRPKYEPRQITDAAFDYRRTPDDARKIWYRAERGRIFSEPGT